MNDNEQVKEDGERLLTAIDVAEHYLTPKARREIAKQIPRGEMKRIVTTIEFFSGILEELLSGSPKSDDGSANSKTEQGE
jgi:hypothetical protein